MSVINIHDQESFVKCKNISYSKAKGEIRDFVSTYISDKSKEACTDATITALANIAYEFGLIDLANTLEKQLIKK